MKPISKIMIPNIKRHSYPKHPLSTKPEVVDLLLLSLTQLHKCYRMADHKAWVA